ncbi:anthrone oxygenase family protein [Streptomyces specialis]|uniref:anthrone oxygenase family protein n=1 Tax=Streptomyces specialis TaxID=498367 RepID=UPI00073E6419|nr:anthrone oxygenase family protein [Streptomyces specialis]
MKVARFAGLLFAGIFAGFLVGVLVLETSLRDYDRYVYAQLRKVELDALDVLASVTLIPALLAVAVLVISAFRAKGPALWLPLAAFALLLVVFVTTLVVNLPINGDQADWDVQAPPSDWADVRDRWQTAHVVRTVAAVFAFGLLAVSALRKSPPAPAALPPST